MGVGLVLVVALVAGLWLASQLIAGAAEQAHPAQGRFVPVAGGRLHMVDTGVPLGVPGGAPADLDAPVVVLLHGASSHHADLLATLGPGLRAAARVIAIDRPGHGWSDRLEGPAMADPVRQAAAVGAALDALGIRKVVLVAHSLAGAMAINLALEQPDRVSGLVLLGAVSHPWPSGDVTWYYPLAAAPWLGPVFTRLLAIPAGALTLRTAIGGVFAPQAAPVDYDQTAQIRLLLTPERFKANAQDLVVLHAFVTRQASRHSTLSMPVTAIAGDADTVVWTDIHSRVIAGEAPRGRLVVLPGVGHMPHHAAPALIVAETLRLVKPAGALD